MKTVTELQGEREHKLRTMQDIVDGADTDDRAMTEEETAKFDKLKEESESLDGQIGEVEQTNKRRQQAADAIKEIDNPTPAPRITQAAQPTSESSQNRLSFPDRIQRQYQYAKLKAFANSSDGQREAYSSGQWLLAKFWNNAKAQRWCNEFMPKDVSSFALSESTVTAGGALVPQELEAAIINLREDYGVFRQNTRVIPMGSDLMHIPRRAADTSAVFVNENTALTESDPTFNIVELKAQKLGVISRFSSELSEDAVINIGDWVAQEFAYAFALKEDTVGFTGDGTATNGSILGAAFVFDNDNTLAGAVDATSGNNSFATIDLADINNVMGVLPAFARRNAKFYMSTVCFDVCFNRIAAAGGGNTIQTFAGGLGPAFLGYPIVISQIMPTSTGTINNTNFFIFGDLSLASTMGDRRGIRIGMSDHRYFELDQVAIKATERFDVSVHDFGDGTNAGPIVALIGQS